MPVAILHVAVHEQIVRVDNAAYSVQRDQLLTIIDGVEVHSKRCFIDDAQYVLALHHAERINNGVREVGCWNYDPQSNTLFVRWGGFSEKGGYATVQTASIETYITKLKFKPAGELISVREKDSQ